MGAPASLIEPWTGEGLSRHEDVAAMLKRAALPGFVLDLGSLITGLPE